MYISKLSIQNYRTFRDFSIKLKPLTLIIGENNVGKSNLLDCIGLIFSQEVSYFKKRVLEVADFNNEVIVAFKKQVLDAAVPIEDIIFPEISIEVVLTDWNEDQEAVIADWFSDEAFTEATLKYSFAPSARFDQLAELKIQRAFITKFIDENSLEHFENLDENIRLNLINFPISKYHYTIYGGPTDTMANGYQLSQLKFELLDALRDACSELVANHSSKLLFRILNSKEENDYQDLKAHLTGLQEAINKNKSLQEIKEGISTQLDKISLKTDETSNLVDLIFSMPDVSDLLKKISLIYGDNPVKIERNGTGRNNLLFISLVLSFIEDISRAQTAYFRVVGIEEPESHLHPNLQDHLAHNIESLIKKEGENELRKDIQLLITSHSTHITTKVDFANTVVLYKRGKDICSHYILEGFKEDALGKKQVRYLNKYLDAVNTNIFYSNKIILVEGISEKLLLPFFFEKITGHSTEKSSCCIVNVNGLAFSYFLEIIKNGYFQKCLVLTDSDAETETRERATNLAETYKGHAEIKVGITRQSTFEKDLLEANKIGNGRTILLSVLQKVRPVSGRDYVNQLGAIDIEIEAYFELIEKYKSEFAYNLRLTLEENSEGFEIPDYIKEGINFLS